MSPPHDTSKGWRLERQFIADWLRKVTWGVTKVWSRGFGCQWLECVWLSVADARTCAGQHHRLAIGEDCFPARHGS
jgi:hypothetical protein